MKQDLIDACVMECYFREHMMERDLLFHATVAPHLADVEQTFLSGSLAYQFRQECLDYLHQTLTAPSHPTTPSANASTASPPPAPIFSPSSNRRGKHE